MSEFDRVKRRILNLEEEERARHSRELASLVGASGIWPLDAPGMPPPGPDFLAAARALGDSTVYKKTKAHTEYAPGDILRDLYARALREPGFRLSIAGKRRGAEAIFVPGHIWGQNAGSWELSLADREVTAAAVDGPHPADVMVLAKMPWKEEVREGRNLVGATGELLSSALARLHVKGARKWYVTNLVKFMPPEDASTLRKAWIHDCLPLLAMELRIVRPKYILCLGADASRALLGDKFNVSYMEGRVVPYTFPVHGSHDADPEEHTSLVMTVLHPAQVARAPNLERTLERGLARFALLIGGARFDLEERGLDHRLCDTLEDAEDWAAEVDAELAGVPRCERLIGWDAEWHGQHPINPGSYLRTIQLSWAERKAICFKVAHQGGNLAFRDRSGKPAVRRLAKLLNRFMEDKRPVGHFFVADLEWLHHYGIDPIRHCPVPLEDKGDKRAWQRLREGAGWLDTAMMVHAVEETAPLGLESVAMRYTTCPRYDIPLEDWKKAYCKEKGIPAAALEGYGDCPDRILVPYGAYDSDVSLRIARQLLPILDSDYEGNCAWEPFWESMITMAPILEIHKTGILVNRTRVDEHTENFVDARLKQEEMIRKWAKWPKFNIRSVQQVREFLFGEALNGREPKKGESQRIRPPGAASLGVEPLLDTSKPPRRWVDLVAKNLTHTASPGTGKAILGILAQDNLHVSKQIGWIRDYRFLDQVLKSILRPPVEDEDGHWVTNDEGFYEYEAGLVSSLDSDGRVRTHISPTTETGRFRSWRPNLQNCSKRRDDDYYRLLGAKKVDGKWVGGRYTHTLRSIFMASPGTALIEFDYIGAELLLMAVMAGSEAMIEHCRRSTLSSKDPDYYDIHANMAVRTFRLNMPPSKEALSDAGLGHLRDLAKCVVAGSRLHTTNGLSRVEDVVGDRLKDDTGERYRGKLRAVNHLTTTPLVGVYNGGQKACVRVTTEKGYTLDSTYEHKYWVMGDHGDMVFRRAGDLRVGDWVTIRTAVGPFGADTTFPPFFAERRTSFKPMSQPVEFTEDWAAFIGLYLAEGSSDPRTGLVQFSLACEHDPEFCRKTGQLLRRLFGSRVKQSVVRYEQYQDQARYVISSTDLARWLAVYCPGGSHTKEFPEFVFRWPQRLLRKMLAWLFEGDGSVKKNGTSFSVTYSTASAKLAEQLRSLLLLFGIVTTTRVEYRDGYAGRYNEVRVIGNASLALFVDSLGFITEAKKRRCVVDVKRRYSKDSREIPGQVERLRALLPAVSGPVKEKCRECVRNNSRVSLSPTRLTMILAAVEENKLTQASREARRALAALPTGVDFQRIKSLEDLGVRQVYDVQTTEEFGHLVAYNGFLTHQTVLFGLAYGRGAKAIALAAKEQGTNVTVAEAQQLIDGIFESYPELVAFFAEARRRALEEKWLCSCFGRFRRFPVSSDYKLEGEFERQAMNFPIQSGVASAVDRGLATLVHLRDNTLQRPDLFRLLLQMHDAGLVEAPYSAVEYLADELIPHAMIARVPIYPTELDGVPTGLGPYHFGLDVSVYKAWGEKFSVKECEEFGIPIKFAAKP